MANNKITLRARKDDEDDKYKRIQLPEPEPEREDEKQEPSPDPGQAAVETDKEYLNEDVWGNDSDVHKRLDAEILVERRRYVRVRYIQNVACKKFCNSLEEEPEALQAPLKFTIFDLSVGGIGVVSDQAVAEGTILVFNCRLDHQEYEIKCQIAYCMQMEEKYRIGLKLAQKDKEFTKHLKIVVARLSLTAQYGTRESMTKSEGQK